MVFVFGCNETPKSAVESGASVEQEATVDKGKTQATAPSPGEDVALPASPKKLPSVPAVSGCTMESIQAVVRTRKKDVTTCYTKGLLEDASIGGRIAIELGIQAGGKLAQRSVYESELPIPVGACMVKSLEGLEFPGEFPTPCVIVYPFVFSSGPRS
jgi:hypothetical protein